MATPITIPIEALTALRGAGVRFAVMFGSVPRGSATAESDLDIGIGLERDRMLSMRDRLDLAVTIERAFGRDVDLVVLDEASPLLRHEAAGGRPIFEASPGVFADFAGRALLEMDDVRPHLVRGGEAVLRRFREGR